MKNQSVIVTLSLTVLTWGPSVKAMEEKDDSSTPPYYKTEEFNKLDLQTQLWLLEEADERDETHLNNLLTTEEQPTSLPLPPEDDPEFTQVLALPLSTLPEQDNKGQPEVEDDPDLKKALAASLTSPHPERKQEKKSLRADILKLNLQIIGLRQDKKDIKIQVSNAWNTYYEYRNLDESEGKKEIWSQLYNANLETSLKLADATSRLDSLIGQYLALISRQGSLRPEGENSRSERGQEKKKLEQGLCDVRFQTAKLREELREKENEAREADETYKKWLLADPTEENQQKKNENWEICLELKKAIDNLESTLDEAATRESGKIDAYFTFGQK